MKPFIGSIVMVFFPTFSIVINTNEKCVELSQKLKNLAYA